MMTLSCWIMTAAVIVTVWHFIYDGIWLPGYRQQLRNNLFEIRDELRLYFHGREEGVNLQAAEIMHESTNNFINKIHHLNIGNLYRIRNELARDENLMNEIRSHVDILASCDDDQLKSISDRLNTVFKNAFFANSGGWLIYIVPLGAACLFISKITDIIRYTAVLPQRWVSNMLPDMAS